MKKLTKSEAGKLGADKTHKKRYDAILALSKLVNKNDLNWIQAKWPTTHIEKLLEAYTK